MPLLLSVAWTRKKPGAERASRARKLACRLGDPSLAQLLHKHTLILHRVREVEILPVQVEAAGELFGQGLDPERLGGVVAAGEKVRAELSGSVERGLRRLAGDEGVVAHRGDLREKSGGAAGDHRDALDPLRPA